MYLAVHSSSVKHTNRLITAQLIALGIAALTLLLSLRAHISSVEYGDSFDTTPLIGLGISALTLLPALAAHGSRVGYGDSFNTTPLIGLGVSAFTLLFVLAAHDSRVGYGNSFNTTPLIGLGISVLTLLLSLTAYSSSVWYLRRFSKVSGSLGAKTSKFTPKSPVLASPHPDTFDIFDHTLDLFFFIFFFLFLPFLEPCLLFAQLIALTIASLTLIPLTMLHNYKKPLLSGIRLCTLGFFHYTLGIFYHSGPATLLDNSESRQAAGVSRVPVREQQAWRLDYIIGTGAYGTVFLENVHLRGMKSPELWAVKRIPQTLPNFTFKRYQAEIKNLEALSRVSISRTRTIS